MTTTPNAGSATGIDLAALEQLALAATPGEWKVERLTGGGHHNVGIRVRGPLVSGYAAALNTRWSNEAQSAEQEANAAYIAAANPATVLALIALARATPQHPDNVLALLNHIEDVVDDANWEKIDTALWNAVTRQYATTVASQEDTTPQHSVIEQALDRDDLLATPFRERFTDAYHALSVAAFASPFWNQSMEELLTSIDGEIDRRAATRAQSPASTAATQPGRASNEARVVKVADLFISGGDVKPEAVGTWKAVPLSFGDGTVIFVGDPWKGAAYELAQFTDYKTAQVFAAAHNAALAIPASTAPTQHSDGWPSAIYLNAGDDPLGNFREYADVSWCDHPKGESDVRYVRDSAPASTAAPEDNASKAVYWFSILSKCARLLDLPDDEPIPSGVLRAVEALIASTAASEQHPDDAAVDRFALAMKAKMAVSRAKGRGGWDDEALCTDQHLADCLMRHTQKGDPVDVANFAMMLHQRGDALIAGLSLKRAALDFAKRVASVWIPEAAAASEQQASVSELPPLPEPQTIVTEKPGFRFSSTGYSSDQMHDYARAALSGRATIPSEADERALFEQEANAARFFPRELDFTMAKSPSGRDEYANSHLQSRWEGWQAGRALTHRATTAEEVHVSVNYPDCQHAAPVLRVVRTGGRLDILVEGRATTATPAEQIANVILHLIGEGAMDWKAGPTGDAEQDAFNSNREELNTLVSMVNKVLAAAPAIANTATDQQGATLEEQSATMLAQRKKIQVLEAALAQQGAAQAQAGDMARLWALHAAVSAIYFDDSSDFRSALGSVIRHLDPVLAGEVLENPKAAYDKARAAMAAPATSGGGND